MGRFLGAKQVQETTGFGVDFAKSLILRTFGDFLSSFMLNFHNLHPSAVESVVLLDAFWSSDLCIFEEKFQPSGMLRSGISDYTAKSCIQGCASGD